MHALQPTPIPKSRYGGNVRLLVLVAFSVRAFVQSRSEHGYGVGSSPTVTTMIQRVRTLAAGADLVGGVFASPPRLSLTLSLFYLYCTCSAVTTSVASGGVVSTARCVRRAECCQLNLTLLLVQGTHTPARIVTVTLWPAAACDLCPLLMTTVLNPTSASTQEIGIIINRISEMAW